ncbi:MAG: 50S ribosomal protein L14e, partial [Candidatus Aenigmarchaeota archaeon]|nr:50S ribosomal protein L14e [Candidatus Aenigmarchaeota archaeon]
MVEVGQICKKTCGREKGRYCVVVKDEGNFVRISGISKYLMCKDKRCNKKHLHPTNIKIELKGDS